MKHERSRGVPVYWPAIDNLGKRPGIVPLAVPTATNEGDQATAVIGVPWRCAPVRVSVRFDASIAARHDASGEAGRQSERTSQWLEETTIDGRSRVAQGERSEDERAVQKGR